MKLLVAFLVSVAAGLVTDWLLKRAGKPSLVSHILAYVKRLIRIAPRTLADAACRGHSSTSHFLVRWLERDQDPSGYHLGQFGRSASLEEERRYQAEPEMISVKPRLYLTGWPCFVLSRRGLAPKTMRLACDGLKQLLAGGVVRVPEGALPDMDPAGRPTVVSYRHTLRAIEILAALDDFGTVVPQTLGELLDARSEWQNPDGGWAQCDHTFTQSDLWTTAYASGLLLSLWKTPRRGAQNLGTVALARLGPTVAYLKASWQTTKWAYGDASAEQNAPILLHEVAPALAVLDPDLLKEVTSWLRGWLTPSGTVSQAYLAKCRDTVESSANARVAYALYLAGDDQQSWAPLFLAAVETFGSGRGCNSCDVAFLLDLSEELDKDAVSRASARRVRGPRANRPIPNRHLRTHDRSADAWSRLGPE